MTTLLHQEKPQVVDVCVAPLCQEFGTTCGFLVLSPQKNCYLGAIAAKLELLNQEVRRPDQQKSR